MQSPNTRWPIFLLGATLISLIIILFPHSTTDRGASNNVERAWNPSARRTYTTSIPEPHRVYRKALIIASVQKEDTNWTSTLPDNVDVHRYINDNPQAEFTVPMNKGNEVMAYLTYLIDHYDRLPEVMVFVHAHEFTHHNPWLLAEHTPTMVRRLSPHRVIREGYMNLHCGSWDEGTCPATIRPTEGRPWREFQDIWESLFPNDPVPEVLAQHCCGQFAISRHRALQVPREEFIRLRQWMFDTKMNLGITGQFWEYLWHFIFTGKNIYCPDQHVCYCDGFGICFEDDAEFNRVNNLLLGVDKLYAEVKLSREQVRAMEDIEDTEPREQVADSALARQDRMTAVMQDMSADVWSTVAKARSRGRDPRIRAERSKRRWEEGDGFN
ncbi:hypothetical protein BDY17DRAFT_289563 [Neohortaea acidophila]|uniref:Uncharacterized protein n=1 Tax=Neohortaea acidophila TaxID=245834 RepID=A0A6A6Q5X2_9PEZI|nr:uncharacterized protein BDY17DRAFT_289563 [Neohortaea acidophila]KAF2487715.1 hypothetical protein BDY17DRAFT_289563 [Neohortaea acidophila]